MIRHLYIVSIALMISVPVVGQNWTKIYDEGIKLIEDGQPSAARLKFQEVSKSPVELGLLDNAEYWIAVSYFDEKQYTEAIVHYRKAQVLPDGNKAAAAQFELALAAALQGDTAMAVMEFYKVLALYPNEGLDERALAKIDSLKGPQEAKIPERGPITPSLASRVTKEATPSVETRPGVRIATSGPLAGTEIPVPPRKTEKTEVPQPIEEQPKTPVVVAESTIEKPESVETKPPQEQAQADTTKPAPKPAQPAAQPTPTGAPPSSAPITVDPRTLIRPEEKKGL